MKWIIPVLLILTSCLSKDNLTPESALKTYMEGRVGTVVTREFILERTTGKMKQSFENMDEEEFAKSADMRTVKKDSFKILSKSCQEKKCFITYSVGYSTENDENKTTFTSEVKKIAEVVSEEGKWLISDVSNIKTYHESLEPINPLE